MPQRRANAEPHQLLQASSGKPIPVGVHIGRRAYRHERCGMRQWSADDGGPPASRAQYQNGHRSLAYRRVGQPTREITARDQRARPRRRGARRPVTLIVISRHYAGRRVYKVGLRAHQASDGLIRALIV